ncbi:MAG TPA: AMP-binding protein [Acidimicrobiales bacterium]|nr:AMP-binding protein [Acidimicrobiales bacterium]
MNLAAMIETPPADSVALVSRGQTTTYGELRDQVAALRGGLAGLGVERGDRVAVICANNWYFVVSYLATLGLGAVVTPLNPLSPTTELENELATVRAKVAIVGPSARRAVADLDRSRLASLETVVVCDDDTTGGGLTLASLLAADPLPLVDTDPGDLAVLIFTSGTAGHPKAAQLSHGNITANIEQLLQVDGAATLGADDVGLGVLPLFHIYGLTVVLGLTFATGSSVVLVERFDPQSLITTIAERGITALPGVPAMWMALANLPGVPPGAFAQIRVATSGADRLPTEVAERIADRFGLIVREGYGLTEASPVVTSSIGDEPKVGSVGRPLPGVRVRVVDVDGADVLVGDTGEIRVSGPNVFGGYWEDDEATAAVLDADGWLHTGDLAVVDEEGNLTLVDRAKDLIIVSGFNVYPAEVEEVLLAHPAVVGCAVVGVPHPYSGEAVKAFVVVDGSTPVEEDEIIAWCADRLARYKCPEKVMFVDKLPIGISGKVLRRELTESARGS